MKRRSCCPKLCDAERPDREPDHSEAPEPARSKASSRRRLAGERAAETQAKAPPPQSLRPSSAHLWGCRIHPVPRYCLPRHTARSRALFQSVGSTSTKLQTLKSSIFEIREPKTKAPGYKARRLGLEKAGRDYAQQIRCSCRFAPTFSGRRLLQRGTGPTSTTMPKLHCR